MVIRRGVFPVRKVLEGRRVESLKRQVRVSFEEGKNCHCRFGGCLVGKFRRS